MRVGSSSMDVIVAIIVGLIWICMGACWWENRNRNVPISYPGTGRVRDRITNIRNELL